MNTVPTDSPSIFAALNTLKFAEAELAIVRPNNPPPGIAGFVFDLVKDDGVELESDIPDHYVEENTPVQDQIALHPEIVTVSGDIAELVKTIPVISRVAPVTNPLPMITDFEPELSPGAQEVQDETEQAAAEDTAAVASSQSLYGYYNAQIPPQPNQTKQSVAFGYIYQLWKGRQLFSVETPWGFFTNMAIQSASARQPENSRSVTEFEITFKKIRTVQSVTVLPGNLLGRMSIGRAIDQRAPVTQNGTVGQLPLTQEQATQMYLRWTPPS